MNSLRFRNGSLFKTIALCGTHCYVSYALMSAYHDIVSFYPCDHSSQFLKVLFLSQGCVHTVDEQVHFPYLQQST